MSAVHDFRAYVQRSNSAADQAFWRDLLPKLFFGMRSVTFLGEDGPHQRDGIDAVIVLPNAVACRVDCKLRETVYPDVLLEYLSDEERRTPGWVAKPLRADWIVYAWRPSGKGVLLPVLQLQEAWRRNGRSWIAQYGTRAARNGRWTTLSVPVPLGALFPAVGDCLRSA